MAFPDIITELIDYFERLPGVGRKTAQRLVFYLLHFPEKEVEDFGQLISDLKKRTQLCKICKNVSENEVCKICSDSSRDKRKILVVTNPLDVVALEKTDFNGVYHVLHGLIDPLSYIGPDDIYLQSLMDRLEDLVGEGSAASVIADSDPQTLGSQVRPGITNKESRHPELDSGSRSESEMTKEGPGVTTENQEPIEIVLATNASMEGESTAHYIRDLIREKGFDEDVVTITRIGRGLPVGGDIEYADDNTLSRALDNRRYTLFPYCHPEE